MNEIPGTVLCGSIQKRCYLYVNQSEERMHLERAQARKAGVQGIADFVFVLDGQRVALSYDELKARLLAPLEPVRLARIAQLMTDDPDPKTVDGRELIRLADEQEKAEEHLFRPTPETRNE